MKASQTCPKCSTRKFAVLPELQLPNVEYSNSVYTLPVVSIDAGGPRTTAGTFETWICLGCGYTELYATGLAAIARLGRHHPDQVRIVDASPREQGPYR